MSETADPTPQNQAVVAVGPGAIFVSTPDGRSLVLTPELAEHLSANLTAMVQAHNSIFGYSVLNFHVPA